MNARSETIHETPLGEALSQRYLAYALSTITSRSLPDVRDGLKPVQRRLMWAMRQLRLDPDKGFKKCARVVGDVMGKYHPHGDQSVYDAMVRLAQDFAQRYPLVDGQGNFGNIDGDNAAAMRYTEARLTAVAEALLAGLDDDTVDFRDTYDGEDSEPEVLPARFPNLLANGASGIAVGMATSIPPHNAGELCAALLHLIKFPRATAAKLVEFVPGPDFPTGGVLVEPPDSVVETYKTGRGSFRLRANWQVEKQKHGQYQIVIDEIPYQVQKGRLIEKLADLINERKLPMLADVRDESAETVRLVLEPRSRSIDPEMLMEQLFRLSDLEVRISLNMNVLDARGTPGVMDLRGALWAFLEHRHEVLVRGSKHRLATIERRLEILAGYLIVYLNVDEVIRIVREEDEPKAALVAAFDLTDVQADAILDMRLRRLRRLEEEGIRSEHAALEAEGKELRALLKNEKGRWQAIAAEIREIKKQFGEKTPLGARRTLLAEAPTVAEVPPEAMVEREPITVICSEKGWLRAVKGHVEENREAKYKEGDRGRFWISAETTDKLVLFATNGRFYTIPCDRIQRGRGHGEPVRLMLDLGNDEDIVELRLHSPGRRLLVAASDGRGFVVEEDATIAQTRSGKQVLNVRGDIEARVCAEVPEGADSLALIGENRKLLIIPLDDVPTMTRGRGVTLQRYKDGGLNDAQAFNKADGLTWRSGERTRTETDLLAWLGKRGAAGRLPPKGFSRANRFG
ncbi:MAG: DNA topoisomerase IV subunit A [Alphaproteobacteria bacterium]|jgi:topoisomerase-4 subunit A|nr:DNA topoisomerase IV subunit A [Rhodospirillaceae bacterium]MDP6407139.1 DNA topoisomerase IV subunit A [Alphaproteobacteria bacterium]